MICRPRKIVGGVVFILACLIALVIFTVRNQDDAQRIASSFDECVAAGHEVMNTEPQVCTTPDGQRFTSDVAIEIPEDVLEHIVSKSDLIVVEEPQPLSVVRSPLTVRGEARGMWYFEADFPIMITDWNGVIIGEWYASALLDPNDPDSTWMTESFVPFEGTLEFEVPEDIGEFSRRGTLIFQKDNPSGLPQHDDALEIPIRFE